MANTENDQGYYLGRFKPWCRNHNGVLGHIRNEYPHLDLTIGVADLQTSDSNQRTKDNFLSGNEAATIIRLATGLPAQPISITSDDYLEDILENNLHPQAYVFSGSKKTIKSLAWIKNNNKMFANLQIINLSDPETGPRATDFRNALEKGNMLGCWRVAQWQVVMYCLIHPELRKRLQELPHASDTAAKRPWKTRAS